MLHKRCLVATCVAVVLNVLVALLPVERRPRSMAVHTALIDPSVEHLVVVCIDSLVIEEELLAFRIGLVKVGDVHVPTLRKLVDANRAMNVVLDDFHWLCNSNHLLQLRIPIGILVKSSNWFTISLGLEKLESLLLSGSRKSFKLDGSPNLVGDENSRGAGR